VPLKIRLFILVSKYRLENFGQGNLLKVIILTQGQNWEESPILFSSPFLLIFCTVSVKQMFMYSDSLKQMFMYSDYIPDYNEVSNQN